MSNNIKKYLFLICILLPCAALGDISSSLSFFAPSSTDYSVTILETVFGVVGNVLHGRGNQLLGIGIGIFNAGWVIAIGIGILYVIWDSVIHAAQSGEMMMGRGKKTVFKIIGIIIGFTLAVPSAGTGYSMAQSGAMWIVVQGVGLADRISDKMYSYFKSGGVVYQPNPATGEEMMPLMPPAASILKSQICMYKLESILDKDKKAQDDAIGKIEDTLGSLPSYGYDSTRPVGYSVNSDNTITVGTRSSDEEFAENGHRYNNECGTLMWNYSHDTFVERMGSTSYDESQANSERAQVIAMMQQAASQMFSSLEPVAKEIAAIDPASETSEEAFLAIADTAGMAMANSGVGYATLMDPARQQSLVASQGDLDKSLAEYNARGWVFTPFLTAIPGLVGGQTISIGNYAPSTTDGDLATLTQISDEDRAAIGTLMGRVDSDGYLAKSQDYLKLYQAGSYNTIGFDFQKSIIDQMLCDDDKKQGAECNDDVEDVVGYLDAMFSVQKGVVEGSAYFIWGAMQGTAYIIEGFAWLAGELGQNKDSKDMYSVVDTIKDASYSARDALFSANDALDDMINGLEEDIDMAKLGGMNNDLMDLTKAIGPIGPVMATMMTAMVGKGIDSLQTNAFQKNQNAMVTAIQIGGDLMVASLEATFAAGKVMFITSIVTGSIEMISEAVKMIPVIGATMGGMVKMVGTTTQLANKGIELVIPLYIGLAMMFFAGGLLLYILVPLSWILLFGAVVLRWVGMVIIIILASPIFCFNLIRSDGEGIIGRGERFLVDLARTAITPALLTLGAVAFVVLFNISFQLVSLILTNFLPLLFKVHDHPYLISISLAAILMLFGLLMVYMTDLLGTLCTSDLVQAVGSAIGEALHHFQGAHGLHDQLKSGVGQAGGQVSNPAKQASESGGGLKNKGG